MRDYKKEYREYQGKPEQIKRRAKRNAARAKMMKLGHVRKGDGKDVHHRNNNPHHNGTKNLAATSRSKNRGYPRDSNNKPKKGLSKLAAQIENLFELAAKPPILERLVKQLKRKGMPTGKAYAIAISQQQKAGNLKKGSIKATKRGAARGKMTPRQRAIDRGRGPNAIPKAELAQRIERIIELSNKKNESNIVPRVIGAGALGYYGSEVMKSSAPEVLGKQAFYHGTTKEAADEIRKRGFDPAKGGTGSASHVNSADYVKNSTGKVHLAKKRRVAAAFASLNGVPKSSSEATKAAAFAKGGATGSPGAGAIVSGHMNYDTFRRVMKDDPDMKGDGYTTTRRVGPKRIGKGSLMKGVSIKSVAKYAKKNPARFLKGVGKIGGGAGLMVAGASLLRKKKQELSQRAENLIDLWDGSSYNIA